MQAINWRSKCWNLRDHPWQQPEKKNKDEYKISTEVREIITNARELAADLGHAWVSAEHIFLAIFKETDKIKQPDKIES